MESRSYACAVSSTGQSICNVVGNTILDVFSDFVVDNATILSVMLGIFFRLGWKKITHTFNHRSLVLFISLFVVQLVAPMILVLAGYQWMKFTGYQGRLNLNIIWIAGHILLILPLLTSFILVTQTGTANADISYLETHKLTFVELIQDLFLRRYLAEYLFTFLIAFSLIWNEGIIGNILSDFIPSFVSEIGITINREKRRLRKFSPKTRNVKTSITFYPNKHKKNRKTGQVPLYMITIINPPLIKMLSCPTVQKSTIEKLSGILRIFFPIRSYQH